MYLGNNHEKYNKKFKCKKLEGYIKTFSEE